MKKILLAFTVASVLWICPAPNGLQPEAWHMFALFLATIILVVLDAMPMSAATLLGLTAMVVTHTTDFHVAFSGYSNEVAWLVFIAFFIAHGFVQTGLARRLAYGFVALLGKNTLGLGYGLCLAEACLAPAIPSVTARSGAIIYPIVQSLSDAFEGRVGKYLMLVAFQASTITSAMFLTAMAGNPLAVKLAQNAGVNISWGTWSLYALVPGLISLALIPLIIYWLSPPEIKHTPNALIIARTHLDQMGPLSKQEWLMMGTFVGLLILWIFGPIFHIQAVTTALIGFVFLILTGVLKWQDLLSVKSAFDTFIWFGAFIAMADAMNSLGLTTWFGQFAASYFAGMHWSIALFLIILVYFYVHYFFASSTAHIGALYLPFLMVALQLGAPPLIAALVLAYASNLFGGLTHYGFGSAPILFGAGFVGLKQWWSIGFLVSLVNLVIWLGVGGVWWLWLNQL